ncbi:hypothetical protein OPV22_003526 [Ensete ventricosum]|uniref:Uncharacterized protein n=1 Tax=Ensete ventricosum TaxID=4639 RepID=A0AAV8S0W4_ENSVE|nr:hypothetical protein OPV22_003526 [Ensete ventricosum]
MICVVSDVFLHLCDGLTCKASTRVEEGKRVAVAGGGTRTDSGRGAIEPIRWSQRRPFVSESTNLAVAVIKKKHIFTPSLLSPSCVGAQPAPLFSTVKALITSYKRLELLSIDCGCLVISRFLPYLSFPSSDDDDDDDDEKIGSGRAELFLCSLPRVVYVVPVL